ncbi:MAG TPA: GyrI-like domain-containing protein [Devosia sp.]|nr:GyrI-like domain-containing protein [Devosia sp.]
MLTLPTIVKRQKQAYAAIRQDVKIPFQSAISKALPKVEKWLAKRGEEHGPMLIKYDLIKMPELTVEMGFVLDGPIKGDETVAAEVLPAGKYATLTYWGHYKNLRSVTGILINWARDNDIAWDAEETRAGESFVSRFELYPNGPQDEPDPDKWETQIFIKVKN